MPPTFDGGHSTPTLTLRTYDFLDVADREAATAIGTLFASLVAGGDADDERSASSSASPADIRHRAEGA